MILPFHPQSDLVDARAALRQMVDAVLDGLTSGRLPGEAERQQVDIKEEAGRRGAGGVDDLRDRHRRKTRLLTELNRAGLR